MFIRNNLKQQQFILFDIIIFSNKMKNEKIKEISNSSFNYFRLTS